MKRRSPHAVACAFLALAWLHALPSCSEGSGADEDGAVPVAGRLDAPPSILFVTIDTLRRDHLGCYGYFRDTSPRIDRLAEEGVLFERALATMATTYPSHLSMLTGLYTHEHGWTSNPSGVRTPFESIPGRASIAAVLRDAGYRTGASVSTPVLSRRTGINAGFEAYRCPPPTQRPREAADTTQAAFEVLDEISSGDEPFFLWVHYWDPHEPNEPEEPFASMFRGDPELTRWIDEQGVDVPVLGEQYRADVRVAARFFGHEWTDEVDLRIDREAMEDLWNRYDADVRTVDHEVGRLLDELAERGLDDTTVVALTADHGQALGENRLFGHAKIVDVNLFVPWIFRFPEGVITQPVRVSRLVSLVDLMPTLLARFDLPGARGFLDQVTGLDVLSGDYDRFYALAQETTETRGGTKKKMRCALLADRWKYVHDEEEGDELYDLFGEGEGVDVSRENPQVASALRKIVLRMVAERTFEGLEGAVPGDEEAQALIENLRDLGYVGE